MAFSTDTFGFNSSSLFEKIRQGLPADSTKTHNLIEVIDDVLFAWDSRESCLLSLNWRAAQAKGFENVKYQTLLLSKPQNFEVDKVLASPEGSLIALSGNHGLTVLELPRRWGPNGLFQDGKERVLCKSQNLDEHFFVNNSHIEVLQIRWHPASVTDSHIVVLISDNTLRVYDECKLRHVWRVGPMPSMQHPAARNLAMSNGLGEVAVDFDIAPPRAVSPSHAVKDDGNTTWNSSSFNSTQKTISNFSKDAESYLIEEHRKPGKIQWPILLLYGNGEIYILFTGIDTQKPHLEGPLIIAPQADRNYGLESCSLIVIPSLPLLVVVAESNGLVHHGLLLEPTADYLAYKESSSNLVSHPSEWTLNIVETVELELGLVDSNKTTSHSCPIHLKRDLINELRYFAYHNTGLHVVTVYFLQQLRYFVESPDFASVPLLNKPSNAEYVVCTRALDKNKVNAVLGFVSLHMPSGILLLLSSGQVVSLNLIVNVNILPEWNTKMQKANVNNKLTYVLTSEDVQKESFSSHIREILKSGNITQPILSLDKTCEPTQDEMLDLLAQTANVLRTQYFEKHAKARNEIIKRVKSLRLMKEQQERELQNLEEENGTIRENAERLAEKYEEIYDKQQDLRKKSQDLLRQAYIYIPTEILSDKDFSHDVRKIQEATQKITQEIKLLKQKHQTQQLHIVSQKKSNRLKEVELPEKQRQAITDIIASIHTETQEQIKEMKKLCSVLNL